MWIHVVLTSTVPRFDVCMDSTSTLVTETAKSNQRPIWFFVAATVGELRKFPSGVLNLDSRRFACGASVHAKTPNGAAKTLVRIPRKHEKRVSSHSSSS